MSASVQGPVSGSICFEGLSRLSLKMEAMLMHEGIERISSLGFKSFNVDLNSCESEYYTVAIIIV